MSDRLDEKNGENNLENLEEKEDDDINDIISALKDEEEDQNINFNKIKNDIITNTLEKEEKKDDQKIEKNVQPNDTTTKYTTTKIFKTTKIENITEEKQKETEEEKVPKINFVLSSVDLKFELDFKKFEEEKIQEIVVIEKRGKKEQQIETRKYFDRIKLAIQKPKVNAFIYKSGKIVCYGAKSIKESKIACFKCVKIIESCGYDNINIRENDIKINNISGTLNFNFKINLKKYHQKLIEEKLQSYYDPDNCPGVLYYKMETSIDENENFKGEDEKPKDKNEKTKDKTKKSKGKKNSKFFIKTSSSGKTNFGGAKDENQIMEEYKKIITLLYKCKI
jgi:TATA-box binding protein (TBP) (component of TFIID and TFIIIB)